VGRAARWVELLGVFGVLPAVLASTPVASRTAAEASWMEAFLELVRAARVAASGRRTLVAYPRPAF
jgi:hypothetical protein